MGDVLAVRKSAGQADQRFALGHLGSLAEGAEHSPPDSPRDENEDLFWGLRGGWGNFGVVTSLEFRLHEADQVFAGPIFYNLDDAGSLLSMFDEFIQDAPEQFGGFRRSRSRRRCPSSPKTGMAIPSPWPWCTGRARPSRPRRS